MPANVNPIFTLTPVVGMANIATANTNRDGTGTLGTVVTGTTNGTRIDRVVVQATVTTAAGVVTLFVYDGVSVTELWQEVLVNAVTPSATATAFRYVISSPDPTAPLLVLPNNYALRAGTTIAQSMNVIAQGGAY